MADQLEPRPVEQFHPSDQRIVSKIDAVLAGCIANLPPPALLESEFGPEPMELDRSPHPRHGLPDTIQTASTLILNSEIEVL